MSGKHDYYQTHYKEYHERTFSIDPSSYLEPFAERLAPGCRILDIGCGSGRDLLWLKNRGFQITGFERSPGLAGIAREMTECTVIEDDFESYDFSGLSTDAILASGSLVHLPHHRLSPVIQNFIKAIKKTQGPGKRPPESDQPQAHLYISLKEGTGNRTDKKGRVFYLWQAEELSVLFGKLGFSVLDFSRTESAMETGKIWLGYVLGEMGNQILSGASIPGSPANPLLALGSTSRHF
jgi:SAM-dependent methyltransferase